VRTAWGSHPCGWPGLGWGRLADDLSGGVLLRKLSWAPHLPACTCVMGKDDSLGKSSSGLPLLLRSAEGVTQEVTTEESDT